MNAPVLIASLERYATILPAVVANVSPTDARWKPPSGAWSILEIVTHLADEEESDFRPRLESTLRDPTADWSPIDPERWAVERKYNEGDLPRSLQRFLDERRRSLAWLHELNNPAWSNARVHPKFGTTKAGDLLASWAAHDWLHLRQITKRQYELTCAAGGEYSTSYAGAWTA